MQEALVEVKKYDIEGCNFCDVLLDKLDEEDDNDGKRKSNASSYSIKNDIDNLQF